MPVPPKQVVLSLLQVYLRIVPILVIVVGLTVLLGWLFDSVLLKGIIPGFATMKVNTALSFVAAGGSLWLLGDPSVTGRKKACGLLMAALVVTMGTLTLVEYAARVDLGIDQLMFRDEGDGLGTYPGRMSPATALNFILAGLALLTLVAHPRISQWIALFVLFIPLLAIVSFVFGTGSFYQIYVFSSVAIHTAITFILLSLGILAARPRDGFMIVVVSDSAAGTVARRLLPLLPLLIFCTGLLRLTGEELGYYDGRFGLAIMVVVSMASASVLVGYTAGSLYRLDIQRIVAEERIKDLNENLERRVRDRTRELQETLASVKQLQGLLPICAWCKKIRDDKDFWHTVEAYVADHSDARFTHGMCPECHAKAMREVKPT